MLNTLFIQCKTYVNALVNITFISFVCFLLDSLVVVFCGVPIN